MQIYPCLRKPTQRAEWASGRVRQAERITFNGNLVGEVALVVLVESTRCTIP